VAGSKLGLGTVDPRLIEDALVPGRQLVARAQLTRAGTLNAPSLDWSVA